MKKKALENTLVKGESASNKHFLFFPSYFLLYQREKLVILAMYKLSCANAFNLVTPKMLSFLKGYHMTKF